MMVSRGMMEGWGLLALRSLDWKGWSIEVAKYIWERYEAELKASGSMLYTWQYDVRWATQALRSQGVLKPVHGRHDLPWEIA